MLNKYQVKVRRVVIETATVEIEAESEADAREKFETTEIETWETDDTHPSIEITNFDLIEGED